MVTDVNYPCVEIAVNQALNKNKWVQLKVNNDVNTAWAFIGGKGFVTVASNSLSTTESLGVAGVRFDIFIAPVYTYPSTGISKIANDGSLLADTAVLGTGAKDWACTRDNANRLMWEVKTDDGGLRDKDNTYSWYDPNPATNGGFAGYPGNGDMVCSGGILCDTNAYVQAVNAKKLCGYSDWRMPDFYTLQNLGVFLIPSTTAYFPDTLGFIWSSTPDLRTDWSGWSDFANAVNIYGASVIDDHKSTYYSVKLVRGGQ